MYSFSVKNIDDELVDLSMYKGKALLVVNTASLCGYTYQYGPLEKLYQQYKDRGFEVLAFPANNFKNQEPGSNQEIKEFCALKYNTTFPVFAKSSVKGSDISPLYDYLTTRSGFNGPISWNFNKFLISPEGDVVARYGSGTDPLSGQIVETLEGILPE
ncbi:MAG: glutathione peroxidase [Candidatus Omnitrophica bacterium]|nr:glutathione peroxidase [Candidatus Omnitrophota bacterium]